MFPQLTEPLQYHHTWIILYVLSKQFLIMSYLLYLLEAILPPTRYTDVTMVPVTFDATCISKVCGYNGPEMSLVESEIALQSFIGMPYRY